MKNIKILFLAANPNGTTQLRLDEEIRSISEKLRVSEYRNHIKLASCWATRVDDLLQALNEHKPHILHFSGHGTERGEIVLVGDDGSPCSVSNPALQALLHTLKDNIEIVVLNSCFSRFQADAILKEIDCVIGMNDSIGDVAATLFAASFYRAIGFGRSVQEAYDQGKVSLQLQGIPEENIPQLICKDGIDPSIKYPLKKSSSSRKSNTPFLPKSLHQLPPYPQDFTGRRKEIQEISHAVVVNSCRIISIQGMGGIGKTALALVLTHKLRDQYKDAQIFIDLRGDTNQDALQPSDVMRYVIRTFHPHSIMPSDQHELYALYLSVLDQKKAVILLDNAKDKSQVLALLPPQTCLLVVTSRERFSIPGAYILRLSLLHESEAVELVKKIAPRASGLSTELTKICGGLPLALRIATTTIVELTDLSIEQYLARMQGAKERLSLVGSSLKTSYDLLPSRLQTAWAQLSIFPFDFDIGGAVAVWGQDDIVYSQDMLSQLLKFSLVEFNALNKRYKLHDLARLFASHQIQEQDKEEIAFRHSKYYSELLMKLNKMYFRGPGKALESLLRFDNERANIIAGQIWAGQNVRKSSLVAQICVNYAVGGSQLRSLRFTPKENEACLQTGLLGASLLEDDLLVGRIMRSLGTACYLSGDASKSIHYFEQALNIFREIDHESEECITLGELGLSLHSCGDSQRAKECYSIALEIAKRKRYRRSEARILGNQGLLFASLGDLQLAATLHAERIRIALDLGDLRGQGNGQFNLAGIYKKLGNVEAALLYYQGALEVYEMIGDQHGQSKTCWELSKIFEESGELQKAFDIVEPAVKYYRTINHPRYIEYMSKQKTHKAE